MKSDSKKMPPILDLSRPVRSVSSFLQVLHLQPTAIVMGQRLWRPPKSSENIRGKAMSPVVHRLSETGMQASRARANETSMNPQDAVLLAIAQRS